MRQESTILLRFELANPDKLRPSSFLALLRRSNSNTSRHRRQSADSTVAMLNALQETRSLDAIAATAPSMRPESRGATHAGEKTSLKLHATDAQLAALCFFFFFFFFATNQRGI